MKSIKKLICRIFGHKIYGKFRVREKYKAGKFRYDVMWVEYCGRCGRIFNRTVIRRDLKYEVAMRFIFDKRL